MSRSLAPGGRPRDHARCGLVALVASSALARSPAGAGRGRPRLRRDPPQCRTVRFSDIGWTDVTATTALTRAAAARIGYSPAITVLSVPVTFASLKNKDIDVFLGNWMPRRRPIARRYDADGSVVVVRPNLVGAKYTLAVPAYTYAAGLKDFSDIHRFAAASSTTRSTASSPATTATASCWR